MNKLLVSAALFLAACSTSAAQDEITPETETLAGKFAGSWSVARPSGEDVIVNEPIASCDNPVVITALDEVNISYASPKAAKPSEFEVTEFAGRYPWWPADNREIQLTEFVSDDVFILTPQDMAGNNLDHMKLEYTRCD